jgi:hypothetical protein
MAELLFKPTLRGPMRTITTGEENPWAGRTVLASGSATITVSTAAIQSDSIVRYGTLPSSLGVAANSGGTIVVSSIVDGVSFALARATGVAVPWDETVMWELVRTSWTS